LQHSGAGAKRDALVPRGGKLAKPRDHQFSPEELESADLSRQLQIENALLESPEEDQPETKKETSTPKESPK